MKLSAILTGYKTYLASAATAVVSIGAYADHKITLGALITGVGLSIIGAMQRAGSKSDAMAAATAVIAGIPTSAQKLKDIVPDVKGAMTQAVIAAAESEAGIAPGTGA